MINSASLLVIATIVPILLLDFFDVKRRWIRSSLGLMAVAAIVLFWLTDLGYVPVFPVDRTLSRGLLAVAIIGLFGVAIRRFISDYRRATAERLAADA